MKVSPGQNYDASKIPRGDGHGVTTAEAGAEAIDRLAIFSAASDTPALHKYGNMALSKVGWGGRKAWWELIGELSTVDPILYYFLMSISSVC